MRIGWIGLGDMGQVIVPRLIEAGHDVTGWNRTRSKAEPLIERGMVWADSPRDVAGESDFVFSMVTNAEAVEAIALGDDGVIAGLGPDGVYLDMSTIDPLVSKNVSGAFGVTGRHKAAIDGAKVVLVDDVVTSGATARACARALKRAGARRVDVLALAMVTDGVLVST